GEGAIAVELGVHLAESQIGFVTTAEQRIAHARGNVVGCEIERDTLIVPEQFSASQLQMVDREGENLLNQGFARSLKVGRPLIRASIGVNHNVNHRMINYHRVKSKFSFEDGN